ncbi:hypothetical protein ABI59_22675 [Acidobacteria bacterium Mor1]|nr:hypothetical protein ABI59_22675 [Acidobacteria bacterium Mor1]
MRFVVSIACATLLLAPGAWAETEEKPETRIQTVGHKEVEVKAPAKPVDKGTLQRSALADVIRGNFRSIQVNVDALNQNIVGDAANEPSIDIDPTDPNNIVVGWREFGTITNDFRQAGMAFSLDGGLTWNNDGPLDPAQFRSDPVIAADNNGDFVYYSLSTVTTTEVFLSSDKGATWSAPISSPGGDKNWMVIDQSPTSIGDGHVYLLWNSQFTCCAAGTDFARSTDGGATWGPALAMPQKPKWGTLDTNSSGQLFVVGANLAATSHLILRSSNARDSSQTPTFELAQSIDLGGNTSSGGTPNPGGLLGQVWVAADRSGTATDGNVYVLGSVNPPGSDPMDVHFIRSTDDGATWTSPIRVNDDTGNAWNWFGTMSVAPNGRIDVVWNDTRGDASGTMSELYYAYSTDAGDSWSGGVAISPAFDSTVGWPQQNKIGDYYDMVSDELGAGVIYSATFNGEQDVYYVRVGDCNANGLHDSEDVANQTSDDCNLNGVPDECEPDCNLNGIADGCDVDSGGSDDCNVNSIPDECDITAGAQDCNSDGLLDECDISLDLETGTGWSVGAPGDTATTGIWVLDDPIGTDAQPEDDHTVAGVQAFVTGQGSVGGGVGENDVDGGATTLFSPILDVSTQADPYIGYWRWYSNDAGSTPNTDVFTIDVSNDGGSNWTNVEVVGPAGPETGGGWIFSIFRVADIVAPTADVQLRFIAEDAGDGSIVEAAIDDLVIIDCLACAGTIPGETTNLLLSISSGTVADLVWSVDADAETYDVYRGNQADASDLSCFQADVVGNSTSDDGQVPGVGNALYYLVNASSCAGTGTLGQSSAGAERTAAAACP